jgi:hypothetical protein
VFAAGIPHEDRPPLYPMARPAICRTPVNSVLVVEAVASRVALDQLVAHGEGFLTRLGWLFVVVEVVGSKGGVCGVLAAGCWRAGCNDGM